MLKATLFVITATPLSAAIDLISMEVCLSVVKTWTACVVAHFAFELLRHRLETRKPPKT
jgi:hypothetical protein